MRRVQSHVLLLAAVALGAALAAPGTARADRVWVVRSGDALSLLAERFHVTVDQLRSWNGLEGDTIHIGQRLVVEAPGGGPMPGSREYEVVEGDTLSEVAERLEVSLDDLLRWNEDLDPNHIEVGQRLRLEQVQPRSVYVVRDGDRLGRIASRYGVSVRDIRRWNSDLRPNRLRVGERIVIHAERIPPPSQSMGAPSEGTLLHGRRLGEHPGYVIRDRDRAYGTQETLEWIRDGFDAVVRRHRDAPRVRIHDISRRGGGEMTDHRSHQSGRDVDISYYQRRCGPQGCPFARLHPTQLDARTQWTLLRQWLRRGHVEAIFIDYALQEPLYRQAEAQGATRQQLMRWFQYPRGEDVPVGIIRHYRNHRNHMHVRFRCPRSDGECR